MAFALRFEPWAVPARTDPRLKVKVSAVAYESRVWILGEFSIAERALAAISGTTAGERSTVSAEVCGPLVFGWNHGIIYWMQLRFERIKSTLPSHQLPRERMIAAPLSSCEKAFFPIQ